MMRFGQFSFRNISVDAADVRDCVARGEPSDSAGGVAGRIDSGAGSRGAWSRRGTVAGGDRQIPTKAAWERVTPKPAPAEKSSPASASGARQRSKPRGIQRPPPLRRRPWQPAEAEPPEVAPAIDVGSIATTPEISDSSLAPLIASAPTPARAASLRITEQQRLELEQGHTDDAIRELAHAISIDPSNSYAYFYLGRAYIARRDYVQAQTFFKRAEIGVASNSAWLGETYAFEGVCLEQAGKSADAVAEYQKALAASPGNLTARVGVTRLSAFMPASASVAAPAVESDQTAPDESGALASCRRSTRSAGTTIRASTHSELNANAQIGSNVKPTVGFTLAFV